MIASQVHEELSWKQLQLMVLETCDEMTVHPLLAIPMSIWVITKCNGSVISNGKELTVHSPQSTAPTCF